MIDTWGTKALKTLNFLGVTFGNRTCVTQKVLDISLHAQYTVYAVNLSSLVFNCLIPN